jgi:CRP/FNR family transcriptional regulator, transcriptional activator FtrB
MRRLLILPFPPIDIYQLLGLSRIAPMRASDQQVVRALHLFADMQEKNFRALMSAALLQSFPPHVVLIREGELPDFLFVLVAGAVEMYASHAEHQTALQVIMPPATFILVPVVRQEVPLMSARTLVNSDVLMIPAEAVRDIFGRDTAFARAVVAELALRFRDMVRALKNQKLRTGTERLANWILQTEARSGHTGRLMLPFEKRLLASLLGMTPENLSRGFATLAAHGLKTEGQVIVISDRQKLQHLARVNPLIEEIAPVKRRRRERPDLRKPASDPSTGPLN